MKVKFDFNPLVGTDAERVRLDPEEKDELLSRISDYVLESVLVYVGDAKSPVDGSKFDPLSTDYSKKVGRKKATLELSGDLLDSVRVERLRGNNLRLTVSDDEQGKADGHNNHSGESPLPLRRFIPKADEDGENLSGFDDKIQKGVKDIIDEFLEERDTV